LQFSFRGWISPVLTIPIGVVFMASFVLLVPALLGPLAHAVGLLLRPLLHLEAELADRQVRRRPVRTSLTIGVVYLAVGMGVGLGTTIINNVDQVRQWYGKTVSGDFFLRAQFPNTATGETEQIDPALESEIRKVPGIASIDTVNFFTVQVAGLKPFVFARDFNSYDSDPQGKELPLELYQADPAEVRAKLLQGEVVVGTVLAHRIGVQPGDWITVNTRHGPQRLQVAALAVDYMVGGDIIYIEQSVARRLFDLKGVNAFVIYAQPGERDRVGTALEELAEQHRLMFQSFADLIKMLDNILYGVIGALWGVMVLGFLVAAFGIANTLTMNVLEQTRELALLRVVAMTRDQVRRMVLSQAGIIGLIGLALGMVAGLNTAKAISLSMMPLLGYPVPFVLHPWLLAGSFLAGMALVLIAAYWPARRAAKLDLLIALQYE
jgi:putative ABC transport system permease protein